MLFKNGYIYTDDFQKRKLDLRIEDKKIVEIGENLSVGDAMIYDLQGNTIIPGLIDIHIHGREGFDTCDAKTASIENISLSLARLGITSFCPTTMTLPTGVLKAVFSVIAACRGKEKGAYIHGVNMEGPFIAKEKKGAQSAEFVRVPDLAEFEMLNDICPISLVDIAPEVDGALSFAQAVKDKTLVSVAHTAANYEETMLGFNNGFSHVTHLFNAMTAITSREPGTVGAAFDDESVTCELICDGFHIAPACLRIAFKQLGEDRSIIVSDAMMAAGLSDDVYELGGQKVFVENNEARLEDGTIAASTTNIYDELHNVLKYGVDEQQALRSCTINPARAIGVDAITGSLSVDKNADLLIVDDNFVRQDVFVQGKQIEM